MSSRSSVDFSAAELLLYTLGCRSPVKGSLKSVLSGCSQDRFAADCMQLFLVCASRPRCNDICVGHLHPFAVCTNAHTSGACDLVPPKIVDLAYGGRLYRRAKTCSQLAPCFAVACPARARTSDNASAGLLSRRLLIPGFSNSCEKQ